MATSPDTLGGGILARMAGFIAVELAFLAALQTCGGPAWVALGVLVCVVQVLLDFRVPPLLTLAPALGWAAWHQASGNRELFFPFCIYLAAHAAGQSVSRGRPAAGLWGGLVAAAFLVVRILERATPRVLAVEFAVTAVILAAVVAAGPWAARRPLIAALLPAVASVAAYAGLAL